jgi:hypothetical protein
MRFGFLHGRLLLMSLGLAGALALMGCLAGCGATATGSGTSSTGGPAVKCGTVTVRQGSNIVLNGDQAGPAEDCFSRAFQHCQPATLTMTEMGVDAGVKHSFTIASQTGTCELTDRREHYVVPTSTNQVATFTCASLAQAAGGGLVAKGCGAEGDITIPAPTASPSA